MKNIRVKDLELEIGRPKIAVPITGVTHEEIMEQVIAAMETPCDMLEWRADYYFSEMPELEEKVKNTAAHMEMIRILDDIDYKTESTPTIWQLWLHSQNLLTSWTWSFLMMTIHLMRSRFLIR